jgi:release factor glutamine methyltransferase
MKVAGNQLKHLQNYYRQSLNGIMEIGEIDATFALVTEHFLGIPSNNVLQHLEHYLNQSDVLDIYDTCKELATQKPLQYILGETYFYGLRLQVSPAALIPRPETEELVDLVLKSEIQIQSALDIGTGSGCIPLALKKQLPKAKISGCDISAEALALANKNAESLQLPVRFFTCDILHAEERSSLGEEKFDLIISNPPYIKIEEKHLMTELVLAHEPHLALFVNDQDDILFYRRIIRLCEKHLNKGAHLFFELNPLSADLVRNFAQKSGLFGEVQVLKDMSGKWRFLKARKN